MTDRSLVHDGFLRTLKTLEAEGASENERELARVARELYELTFWHPPVIELVNNEALRAMEAQS